MGNNRILQYLIVLVTAITLNFLLPRLMPGTPLALLAGVDVGLLSSEERAAIMANAGLDRPLYQQYFGYWGDILRGEWGYSYRQKQPISQLLWTRLNWTLLLTGVTLLISTAIGVGLGMLSARWRGRALDTNLLWAMIMLNSLPAFWLGMLFIALFAVHFNWLPAQGAITPALRALGWTRLMDIAAHAILPVLTLSLVSIPDIYLTTRYTLLNILGEEYIRTATAKGLNGRGVWLGHILPNIMTPLVTILALRLGYMFSGSVVVETVFSYPGLGRLIFEAVSSRDYPVMQATFLVFTLAVLLSNLLADLLCPRLDPRMKAA